MTQELIDSSYDWFLGLVAERRAMDDATARRIGDGRIYTGWQAVENGLVDEVGGEEVAIAWLAEAHAVDSELPVTDWVPAYPEIGFAGFVGQALGEATVVAADGLTGKTQQTKRLTLDGLTSVWQPDR